MMGRLYPVPGFPWFRSLLVAVILPIPALVFGAMFLLPSVRGIVMAYVVGVAIGLVWIVLEGLGFYE